MSAAESSQPPARRCSWTAPGSRAVRRHHVATSPATGEELGTVPDGDREDARAAIAAARRAAAAGPRLSAFDRAALLHRVADVIEGRRDELARTLTLDQGKPLRAEAYDEVDELVTYWRMAAEDGKRLGGLLPNRQRRQAGAAGPAPARRGRRDHAVELAVHDARRADRAGAGQRQHRRLDAGAVDGRVRAALAGCLAAADLPPGVSTW